MMLTLSGKQAMRPNMTGKTHMEARMAFWRRVGKEYARMIRYSSVSLMWAGRWGSCHVNITRHTAKCQATRQEMPNCHLPLQNCQ